MDLAMPFMIQFMKDYVGKVDTLMADRKDNMEARKVNVFSVTHRTIGIAGSLAAAVACQVHMPLAQPCCACLLCTSVMSSVYQSGSSQSRNLQMLQYHFACVGI